MRESRRAAFFRFPVSSFSFEMYTVEELCIRECCGQGFDKHESFWKGRDGVWGREQQGMIEGEIFHIETGFHHRVLKHVA